MRTEPGGALNIWLGEDVRACQAGDDVEPGIERQGLVVAIAPMAAGPAARGVSRCSPEPSSSSGLQARSWARPTSGLPCGRNDVKPRSASSFLFWRARIVRYSKASVCFRCTRWIVGSRVWTLRTDRKPEWRIRACAFWSSLFRPRSERRPSPNRPPWPGRSREPAACGWCRGSSRKRSGWASMWRRVRR